MAFDAVHAWPTTLAAFLASAVEFVEALTVVLAVGVTRGWRGAVAGGAGALACLLALVVVLGPALTRLPLGPLQLVVGALLLLFGLRWLRKAILRAAGVIPLHDEAAAFARGSESLRNAASVAAGWDLVAVGTAFQVTVLEGLEVVFIVVAMGAGGAGLLVPAGVGALAALALVLAAGVAVRGPLLSVPENALKFGVGVLLSGFGTFWVGEGLGLDWPGADLSIPWLCLGFLAVALATVPLCRHPARFARVG